MARVSHPQPHEEPDQQHGDAPRPLTPQELHERQRELVRQSLSACPAIKPAAQTHRRWA